MPYKDTLGNWTVGYGHYLGKYCDKYSAGITVEHGLDMLRDDIGKTISECAIVFPWLLGLDEPRQDVIYEMCFQLGVSGVSKFHHMITAIRDHDWAAAADSMLESLWHEQTPSRCEELAEIMLNGLDS